LFLYIIIYLYIYELSIIKHLIKLKYNVVSLDYHFTEDGNHIRTQKYCFTHL